MSAFARDLVQGPMSRLNHQPRPLPEGPGISPTNTVTKKTQKLENQVAKKIMLICMCINIYIYMHTYIYILDIRY